MIKSIYENSLDQLLCIENSPVITSWEIPVFDVYPDPDESSHDSLDFIANVLAKIKLKTCQDHTLAELLDNL